MKSILCLVLASGAAVATAAKDPLIEARRLAEAGMVELNHRRISEAETAFREAARLLEGTPEGADPAELPVVLNNLAAALTLRGESARAVPVLRRALYLLDPKHPAVLAVMTNLARVLIDEGDFGEAAPLVDRVLESGGVRRTPYQACALALRAQIELHRKRPEGALDHAEAALELTHQLTGSSEPLLVSRIRWIRAQALAATGRKVEAAAEVQALLQMESTWDPVERRILEGFRGRVRSRRNRWRPHI